MSRILINFFLLACMLTNALVNAKIELFVKLMVVGIILIYCNN